MNKTDLTELNKLEKYLKDNGFEYIRSDEDNTCPPRIWKAIKKELGELAIPFDRHQITVLNDGCYIWDVICQFGSFGVKEGLLEGMGSIFEYDVEGYLTAEDVIRKIKEQSHESI